MIDEFILGQPVTLSASFDVNGTPTDPTALTLTVEDAAGDETVYTFGVGVTIVKDSDGEFHATLVPAIQGRWVYRFVGTGTASGANEGEFLVTSGIVAGLEILTAPGDLDSVRALLGVEEVDLEDRIIYLPLYGPTIEARVKALIPDWETALADDLCSPILRATVAYGVAAQLAESYMKGGTVSLVHQEQPRRNWSEWARIFWQRYEQYLARVRTCVAPTDEDYDMPSVRLAGPSRSTGTRPDWTGVYPPVWPLPPD